VCFPEEEVEIAIRELLSLKREIEDFFESNYPDLSIAFSTDIGELIIVCLEPFTDPDILGETVNRASRLGNNARGGGFVISREVYERLGEATRRRFRRIGTHEAYTAV
jgi:class 3 adenylate cyclase